jgi:hypothetical protein
VQEQVAQEVEVVAVIVNTLGAFAAAVSAACWIKAASIAVPLGSWWDGPPPDVVQKARDQAWWNGMAALAAGFAAGTQSWLLGWNAGWTVASWF